VRRSVEAPFQAGSPGVRRLLPTPSRQRLKADDVMSSMPLDRQTRSRKSGAAEARAQQGHQRDPEKSVRNEALATPLREAAKPAAPPRSAGHPAMRRAERLRQRAAEFDNVKLSTPRKWRANAHPPAEGHTPAPEQPAATNSSTPQAAKTMTSSSSPQMGRITGRRKRRPEDVLLQTPPTGPVASTWRSTLPPRRRRSKPSSASGGTDSSQDAVPVGKWDEMEAALDRYLEADQSAGLPNQGAGRRLDRTLAEGPPAALRQPRPA